LEKGSGLQMPFCFQIGLPSIKPQDFKINPLLKHQPCKFPKGKTAISNLLTKTSVLYRQSLFVPKLEDKERL